jgi:CBS domain-containing protein
MLIREVMTAPAITVTTDTSTRDALRLLDRNQITALPVVDRHGNLVGVLSEADLLQDAVLPEDRPPAAAVRLSTAPPVRRIGEVMTHLVVTVTGDSDLDQAVELMTSTMLKSLPVVDHGRVIGVVSRRDVIHMLATRDQRIRADVAELLRSECPDWLVEVDDGVVRVTGPDNEHQRRIAEVLAGTVTGVVAVHVQ